MSPIHIILWPSPPPSPLKTARNLTISGGHQGERPLRSLKLFRPAFRSPRPSCRPRRLLRDSGVPEPNRTSASNFQAGREPELPTIEINFRSALRHESGESGEGPEPQVHRPSTNTKNRPRFGRLPRSLQKQTGRGSKHELKHWRASESQRYCRPPQPETRERATQRHRRRRRPVAIDPPLGSLRPYHDGPNQDSSSSVNV